MRSRIETVAGRCLVFADPARCDHFGVARVGGATYRPDRVETTSRTETSVADWIETYRGVVNAWECDIVEHFTVAYYFDRLADASRNLLDAIGLDVVPGHELVRRRLHVTFQKELRAGASFHIDSALIGVEDGLLRVGHRLSQSSNGEVSTWGYETIAAGGPLVQSLRQRLEAAVSAYPGPEVPEASPAQAGGMLATRDRVKQWEADETGTLSLPGHVHRFSSSMMQALVRIGMDDTYMQANRRGFSTFELDFNCSARARIGEPLDIHASILNLGKSSLRFLHVMTGRGGRPIATMRQSGVHLDLDARKSTALPDELRAAAEGLVMRK